MKPQTLKLLILFFLVAALLNLMNYLFCAFYNPPTRRAFKLKFDLPKNSRRFETRVVHWTDSLVIGESTTKEVEKTQVNNVSSLTSVEFPAVDYREQSSETGGYYYYNGIRKGPDMCPLNPPGLGPLNPNKTVNLDIIENLYAALQPGGVYEVNRCVPRQTVAIIVPYSGQRSQLTEFVYSIHPFLITQQLEYQIFVVEQGNKSQPLNRGKLMNVGFTEAQRLKKNGGWRCMVFHHHDLVPLDTRNLYRCTDKPRQLVGSLLSVNKSYEFAFGGAIAIKPKQFSEVNGFSNMYSGSDSVYKDFYKRLINGNMTLESKNGNYSYYTRLPATSKHEYNNTRFHTVTQTASPLNLLGGLSTLSYKINNVFLKTLYTLIEVNLDTGPYQTREIVNEKLWDKLLNQITTSEKSKKKIKK